MELSVANNAITKSWDALLVPLLNLQANGSLFIGVLSPIELRATLQSRDTDCRSTLGLCLAGLAVWQRLLVPQRACSQFAVRRSE